MIIVMKPDAREDWVRAVIDRVEKEGLRPVLLSGTERKVIAVIGDERRVSEEAFSVLKGVERVMPVLKPYKLVSREFQPESSIVRCGGVAIGGKECVVMAGPCAVESEKQIIETALAVKAAGARILRGGAFKPRTGPYDFQGLQKKGLEYLQSAKKESGLPIVTEVVDPRDVPLVGDYADMFQIGTRNMQNFLLLREVGKTQKPVLLKRGMQSLYKEFLLAAEYILSEGNRNVVLCERGIRTFETHTRNTLDLNLVPAVKELSHLPIVVDPSHGTGRRGFVAAMSRAAIAAGADGLILEVHPAPDEALTDADQTISTIQFAALMKQLSAVADAVDRVLPSPSESVACG
ncbi:MAG: 3-deoxy-7-phosphoheptulonate synthase [Planctomycetes bacterium]|nr:3-deoxy-7-phosphoheptulonate synthase [Planctomycetota bacterium]